MRQLRHYSDYKASTRKRHNKGVLPTLYAQYHLKATVHLTCACRFPLQHQLSCSHLIALASARGELRNCDAWIQRSCSRWFHEDYLKTLEGVRLEPICMREIVPDEVTTAPSVMQRRGRPGKHKRQESRSPKEKRLGRRVGVAASTAKA
ncbi:Lantibiotic modifying enzyme [Perkinsela sp. CCAP 1560/4]|nr:Lantibiotic modifying enzyme [Perkinsela sp. CCAP 1560/4]|eukprot:KNH05175.1 Lantibiotic modifying enzyme [Perkinsela sp. CCAP 1560/4]